MTRTLGCMVAWALVLAASGLSAATVQQNFTPSPRSQLPEMLRVEPGTPLEQAEAAMRARIAADAEDAQAWQSLGTVLYAAERPDEAAAAWDEAHRIDEAFAPARVMAAVQAVFALQRRGDQDGARRALGEAEREFGADPHFLMIRGEQAMRGGNAEAALASYRAAHDAAPALYATALNLARVLEARGEGRAAAPLYEQAVALAEGRAGPLDHLGQFLYRSGDTAAAEASLRRAEAADPRQPLAEVRLAELALAERDLPGAHRWYRLALARAEAGQDAIGVALSDVQLRLDLIEEARDTLDAVLATAPVAPVLVARGYVDERLGDLEGAVAHYRRAVAVDPGNLPGSNNLAMALIKLGRNPDEALVHAQYAHERLPGNAAILGTRALALWHAGQFDEALPALAQAVRVDPLDPWLRLAYGEVLLGAGRAEDARIQGEACLVLDPRFPRRTDCAAFLGPR